MNSVCIRRPAEFLRVVETALERHAFGRRQLVEDLLLVLLRQVLQQGDRVVRVELADAGGHRAGRQKFEDFITHRVVDFGQDREVEIRAHQGDEARAQLGIERLDQVAGIGLVQLADQRPQRRSIQRLDRGGDPLDIVAADGAVLVAQLGRRHGCGQVGVVRHGGPHRAIENEGRRNPFYASAADADNRTPAARQLFLSNIPAVKDRL